MSCCESVYKFCKPISSCSSEGLKGMFKTLPHGAYVLKLNFLQSIASLPIVVAASGIEIYRYELNESFTYTAQLFDALGDVVPMKIKDESYNQFQFSTALDYGYGVSGSDGGGNGTEPVTIIFNEQDEWDSINW